MKFIERLIAKIFGDKIETDESIEADRAYIHSLIDAKYRAAFPEDFNR